MKSLPCLAVLITLVAASVDDGYAQRSRTRRPPPPARFDAQTPLRLEVDAGAKASLRVPGSRLYRPLTNLRIETGGRVVRGVRASVLSRSPDALVLEIAVDRRVSLSSDGPYELVAYDGRRRLSVPVYLTTTTPDPSAASIRVSTPRLVMTGLRFPIEVETTGLRMTGLRFPIEVETTGLRMTGIREEEP